MTKETFYTGIDIGTTKVCTLIARVGEEGELKVVGVGEAASQGVHKGQVGDIMETRQAVQKSLEESKRYLGNKISWAYVSISGSHISCMDSTGRFQQSNGEDTISHRNVESLINSSYPKLTNDQEVLHVIPRTYDTDGAKGVRNPVGLHAKTLEVKSHVVLGGAPAVKNILKAVKRSGISVKSLVLAPLAAAEACLTEDEREMGVVLVDIGGGTTDIAVFNEGSLSYTAILPVGGNQLTRDLSVALSIPFYFAEELKIRWGHALLETADSSKEVMLPTFQRREPRTVSRREVCNPLYERLSETVKLVLLKLRGAGMRALPPGGIVFTGGTAEIRGLTELGKKLVGGPIRIAYPLNAYGLPNELKSPTYSTSLGTLLWGIKHHGEKRAYGNGAQSLWRYNTIARTGYNTIARTVKKAVQTYVTPRS